MIGLSDEHSELGSALIHGLRSLSEAAKCTALIESQIKKLVKFTIPDGDRAVMDNYLAHMLCGGIGQYCETTGISVKRSVLGFWQAGAE